MNLSLYAAVWLPRFQLQAVMRTTETVNGASLGVLDGELEWSAEEAESKGRVLHANEVAERSGVVSGMTPSQALARCGKLVLLRRSADEEVRAQKDLLECASLWTPDYEATQPGLCVLDLSHVRNIREHCHQSANEMRQWLTAHQLKARIGFATNPDMARLAARAADGVLVLDDRINDDRAVLKQLPIAALQPSAAIAEVLRLWGVRTLAQLAALKRTDVAARLGMEGVRLWDMAAGGRERLLKLVRPITAYRDELELEHPIESVEPLLFILRRMLDQLCAQLAGSWLVAATERIELRFDDKTTHERVLRVAEPTRDADLLLRVLHTHLDGLSAGAPIIAVTLELTATRPAALQTNLFERSLRDPNRFAETLAQLEALLGAGKVGKVRLLPSRRPDAFTVVNFLDASPVTQAASSSRESITHGLPLRCFRPPREVKVLCKDGRPTALQTSEAALTITDASDAWMLSGDWWDKTSWQREVWEIAVSDGALYQLAKEKGRWVLDGVFG